MSHEGKNRRTLPAAFDDHICNKALQGIERNAEEAYSLATRRSLTARST